MLYAKNAKRISKESKKILPCFVQEVIQNINGSIFDQACTGKNHVTIIYEPTNQLGAQLITGESRDVPFLLICPASLFYYVISGLDLQGYIMNSIQGQNFLEIDITW